MKQGLNERAVTKAQATLDATIQDLTTGCKTRQEKRVADAKVKVVEITESISRKIDDEVSRQTKTTHLFEC